MTQALFGIDIRGIVAANIGPGAQPATLVKLAMGTYDVNNPTMGLSRTTTSYACKAIVSKLNLGNDKGDLVRTLEGEITVILGTLPDGVIPVEGDTIALVPPGYTASRTFIVGDGTGDTVKVDPAGATAVCKVMSSP